ncbi:uroporphyrinogen-III C-methyltransferase [Catenovulum sp. SM1970]|uniref:siroheme synthase CysG n=1 Tax=Marinifaba aquimaris TaxID=2741323 RepID=UPI001572880E|nr:siroheme synthase CysG [Marinifaba aquimaris]NTS78602.1 uroporphyrinogen-III C-methyltransferase [Marinifaba aquimaris]
MQQFPIFLNLDNFACAVVGGGDIAFRKVNLLIKSGAHVNIISPELCEELIDLKEKTGKITWHKKNYEQADIADMRLVIAATDDEALNETIYHYCEANKILVNAVDQPDCCRYTTPSIIDRAPITIAISSAGKAPVLARRLRAKLEVIIPKHLGELASYAGRLRNRIKQEFTTITRRRLFWERFFTSRLNDDFDALSEAQRDELTEALIQEEKNETKMGEVWLVGAGPGDADLLTIKAIQKMQLADVILHDRLVSKDILDLARKDADFISVAKQKGYHSKPQDNINELLIKYAKAGKKVCRLKGGDPFIFGRGGEELEALVEHQIPFQVVPAVTASIGCSSYAGIPLTHRDYAQGVSFVTGHCRDDDEVAKGANWQALAQSGQTIVVYMGLTQSARISASLIEHGLSADTPVALIEKGSTSKQRVVTGKLSELRQTIDDNQVISPAIIIIGQVVELHDKLAWYQKVERQGSHFAELASDGKIEYRNE